jgi:Ser/Thr protein kinase RdoA (MazF antagonist)
VELRRAGLNRLPQHLADHYGFATTRLTELDSGVFRADRADGPSWVVRVFPAARPIAEVEADAGILGSLAAAGFPAERCAHPRSVSVLDGQGVLVTEFAESAPALRPGKVFAILGGLLGALATNPATELRAGGAWHTLTDGDPAAELRAARGMLDEARPRVPPDQRMLYDILRGELASLSDFSTLPTAFIHPDFVPQNALPTTDERLVIIDWAGAGRGPRVWSLGFLLYAAGARSPRLVELVISHYRKRVELEPDELALLEDAICGRPIVLAAWSFCAGRAALPEVLDAVQDAGRIAQRTAAQVRDLLGARA